MGQDTTKKKGNTNNNLKTENVRRVSKESASEMSAEVWKRQS